MRVGECVRVVGIILAMAILGAAAGSSAELSAGDYARFALTHSGRAQQGEVVFKDEGKAACAKCHSVDGVSLKAGPDLSSVAAKFSRADLVKAILEPSANIAIGYATTRVTTQSGEEYEGILQRATNVVVLMTADGQNLRIDAKDVSTRTVSGVSLMPEGLHLGMSREEFADLVAYLLTLRPSANGGSSGLTPAGVFVSVPVAEKEATFTRHFPENIRFQSPIWFGEVPGRTNLHVILEMSGKVWTIEGDRSAATQKLFLDLSGTVYVAGGCALLGGAFHPRFAENRKYYLKYNVQKGRVSTVIVERQFTADFRADAGIERVVIDIPCVTQYHTGGAVDFGPDGFLYIGMGDSGPQRDPRGNGQNLGVLLGKILRIDADRAQGGLGYSIPADNPFRNRSGARGEIWAYGFREPWRLTFDRESGDLWVGDVGQDRIEEVGIVRAGENHGWNVYEGAERFSETFRRASEQYQMPIFAYLHSVGVSITGGYVYRGTKAPALRGHYICADFESQRVWALAQTNRTLSQIVEIGSAPSRPVSFSEGRDGELYIVGHDSGIIYQLGLESVDTTPLKTQMLALTSEQSGMVWRMCLIRPGEGWYLPQFDDRTWTNAFGGFGTAETPGALVGTEWRGENIWLRREFMLPPTFSANKGRRLVLRIHHDEDATVYLNGQMVARLPRSTTEYIETPLGDDAVRALRAGRNVLALHCRQTRGGQYIDAGLIEYIGAEAQAPRAAELTGAGN
jgi:putative heme-binding domain-containing protein